MPECPSCGRNMMRTHRTVLQKTLYGDVFRCTRCGHRSQRLQPPLRRPFAIVLFLWARHTTCIRCGTPHVSRSFTDDPAHTLSRNPLSFIFRLTGAPLNKCLACRLRYFDWRRPLAASDAAQPDAAAPPHQN